MSRVSHLLLVFLFNFINSVFGHENCILQIPPNQCAQIALGQAPTGGGGHDHGSGARGPSIFAGPNMYPGATTTTTNPEYSMARGLPGKRGSPGPKGEKGDAAGVDEETLSIIMARLSDLETKMNVTEDNLIAKEEQILQLQAALTESNSRLADSIQALADFKVELEEKGRVIPKPKSCSEVTPKENGVYVIQPDLFQPPFEVDCIFNGEKATTSVRHDSQDEIEVSPKCDLARCYKRSIQYGATMQQMRSLIKHVGNCRQFVKYRCQGSALFRWGNAAWESYDGTMHTYWGGANGQEGYCGCGARGNCLALKYNCNCDANAMIETSDSGYLSQQSDLPVKRLFFGDTGSPGEYGFHTLGPLECIE